MADRAEEHSRDHTRTLLVVICVGYAVLRSVLAVGLAPALYSDTGRYWQPTDPFSVFDVWTGSMAPSLLPQLLYLLPLRLAMFVQGAIAGLVWGFAAATVMIASRLKLLGLLAGGAILLLGLLPYNAGFENSVLSESLGNSFSLLSLVCAFLACAPATRKRLGITLGFCAIAGAAALAASTLSRPSTALILLPCLVAAALFQPRPWRLKAPVAVVSGALVLSVVAWGVAATVHETERAGWFAAANRLGARISPAYLEQANAAGLPECGGLGERLLSMPQLSDRLNLVHSEPCPELQAWLEEGGLSVVTQVRELPAETLTAWRAENYLQWQPVVFQEMRYPMLEWPRFAGRELYLLNRTYYTIYVGALIIVASAAVLTLILSVWVPRLSSAPVRGLCGLFLVFGGSVVGYSFVTWVLDTYETRHFLPVQSIAPVLCLIVPLYVIRELVDRPG